MLTRKAATPVQPGKKISTCLQPHLARPEQTAQPSQWNARAAAMAAAVVLTVAGTPVMPAFAAVVKPPPIVESADRCSLATLDNFADTRATFSQEASSGAMIEAVVDVRGCDFHGKDLSTKVMSGVLLQDADFSDVRLVGAQMARADARGSNLANADLTDVNAYSTLFDGANLEGVQFENAILSSASFGKHKGKWANLKGAHFEGALLSSSDVGRVCQNPTLDESTRKYELGCRGPAPKLQ